MILLDAQFTKSIYTKVLVKTIRAKGHYPQGKGRTSFELSNYFIEVITI